MKNSLGYLGLALACLGEFVGLTSASSQHEVREYEMEKRTSTTPKTYSIGILVFPGWEPLDVYGPLQIFGSLSYANSFKLSIIASKTGPINSTPPPHRMDIPNGPILTFEKVISSSIYATHTFASAPALDIIIVPGGMGNMALDQNNDTSLEDFVAARFKKTKYVMSVCNGAVTLAKAGVLKGRRATTTKALWWWVTPFGKGIKWVPTARWVVDGKVWTSSGVTSGMDMTYEFVKQLLGAAAVNPTINGLEYTPHTNPDWDPFSVVFDIPGADKNRTLIDCIGPLPMG